MASDIECPECKGKGGAYEGRYNEVMECVKCKGKGMIKEPAKEEEKVNHPRHYGGDTTYETIKVIEAWQLGFNLGNAVKYISRADHKETPLVDLEKAAWYLAREIANRKKPG